MLSSCKSSQKEPEVWWKESTPEQGVQYYLLPKVDLKEEAALSEMRNQKNSIKNTTPPKDSADPYLLSDHQKFEVESKQIKPEKIPVKKASIAELERKLQKAIVSNKRYDESGDIILRLTFEVMEQMEKDRKQKNLKNP